ncbi:DNA helicase [Corticibacterium sp. UT-5YL-CI-8]|nr:DNA helicase [Tianweitania sp. UT-5YL-CI-8]
MRLSQPIYRLKRKAKLLGRDENIPLHAALDRVAAAEGFKSWSLLAARAPSPAEHLYASLRPGDVVLLGARPGQGKTLMGLQLALEATHQGKRSAFFTLEYTERDTLDRLRRLGVQWMRFPELFSFDSSENISADHIVASLATQEPGTLAVIDYLQLLDQKRNNPALATQVETLADFARERGHILVFLSQIDRAYDPSKKPCPDLDDVRLPNPLDLSLFSGACFLNDGEMRFRRLS